MSAPLPDSIIARSACDRTDDWPNWFVAGSRDGLNITGRIAGRLGFAWPFGAVFADRAAAEHLAEAWNAWGEAS